MTSSWIGPRQGTALFEAVAVEAGDNQPGGGTVRIGGRVPWGAEVEYAYCAGYDSRGRVSVPHMVDERGYSMMRDDFDIGIRDCIRRGVE